MCPSYTTRSGRLVRPPVRPSMPLPPEETDDEETDPTFDPAWMISGSDDDDDASSSSSSPSVDEDDEDDDDDDDDDDTSMEL